MNSKDLFQLAVRLLGLGFVYQGLTALPAVSSAIVAGLQGSNLGAFFFAVFATVWPLLIAYWLLCGAPLLMQIAYPGTSSASTAAGFGHATNTGRPGGVGH